MDEIIVIREGLCFMQICTSIPPEQKNTINDRLWCAAGTSSRWRLDESIAPVPCAEYDGRWHYICVCENENSNEKVRKMFGAPEDGEMMLIEKAQDEKIKLLIAKIKSKNKQLKDKDIIISNLLNYIHKHVGCEACKNWGACFCDFKFKTCVNGQYWEFRGTGDAPQKSGEK